MAVYTQREYCYACTCVRVSAPCHSLWRAHRCAAVVQLFHPNITYEGKVCLNILREDWRPVYDLSIVINGLLFLFYEPNATDPLNRGALSAMQLRARDMLAFACAPPACC
ncbi:hypothetical protein EON66_00280 [archaeon]|nr:MAG: hypothetical protein EON66_00280 [archaeon]